MNEAHATSPEWMPPELGDGTKYLQIVELIRQAIRAGDLRPGQRLPTQRKLARQLFVTISTVTQAYSEAARLHLVSGEVGRGTFVLATSGDARLFDATANEQAIDRANGNTIDLSANSPAVNRVNTDLTDTLRAIAHDGLTDGYPTTSTIIRGQLAFERLLQTQRVPATAEHLVLTSGAQQGLFAALLILAGPGGKVLAEELTFPGLKTAARQLRIELVPVRIDSYGILPDDLARQAKRTHASTLVCVPLLQNPTGTLMTPSRLDEVAAVVRREGLTVIEDDAYGALTESPRLKSYVPESTVLVTTASKVIEASLRIGAMAVPVDLIELFRRETPLTTWGLSTMSTEVFARWTAEGTSGRRIEWQRKEVAARWRIADQVLGESDLHPAPHRFIRTVRSADRAVDRLAANGVLAVSSSTLGVGPHPPKGLRISLTAAPSRAVLREALTRVATTLGSHS